jgi:hypothetical protein
MHVLFLPLLFSFQDHGLGQDDTKKSFKSHEQNNHLLLVVFSLFFFTTCIGKGHFWVLGTGGQRRLQIDGLALRLGIF